MKSQDRIEDSKKIPEGRKINRDFHFLRLFFNKNSKKTPSGCKFLFYRLQKWLKARKEVLLISLIFFGYSFKNYKKFNIINL